MYVPGEAPESSDFIKLNTNESPFEPPESVRKAVYGESENLNFYNDPDCTELRRRLSEFYGVKPENIITTNGSDEALYFAFTAFGDEKHPVAFPDISYSYYSLYSDVNRIPAHKIPLKEDFSLDYRDYCNLNETIVIANPNAPTGLAVSVEEIEQIVKSNPENVVLIDEAYIDFGAKSALPLIKKYKNLLITRTFSKSRSMAGARLGFGIADEELISELNRLKYSVNPYNINRMTLSAGIAALNDNKYFENNCRKIIAAREYASDELKILGFKATDSCTNFLFVHSDKISAKRLFEELRREKILVRYWDLPRISDWCRITVGTMEQMKILVEKIKLILERETLK